MKSIALILPAYNEESTIEKSISDFNKNCPEAEIWVINNSSTDKTKTIALEIIRKLTLSLSWMSWIIK